MPLSPTNALPFSSPRFEDFAKDFIVKQQQIVENVLRESCTNAIQAITRQTCNLMVQEEFDGCLAHGIEPKLASEPKLGSRPLPSVLGANKSSMFERSSTTSEDSLLTPLRNTCVTDNYLQQKASTIVGTSRGQSPTFDQGKASVLGMKAAPSMTALPSIASPFTKASSLALNKHKMRASVRSTVFEISKEEENQLKVARGVYADFADVDAMKERLRSAVTQQRYHVTDFYYRTGICQAVARSHVFELITLLVIAVSALWISIDVDHNDAAIITEASPVFIAADNTFCAYFLLELLIRFFAFEVKRNTFKDAWFVFDLCMLVAMVFDTWLLPLLIFLFAGGTSGLDNIGNTTVLKAFRLIRIVRLARVLKIVHALPELLVVIKGLFVATRAVSCTVILMLLIIYIFAITFRHLCADTELGNQYFNSVPETMRYLLVLGTTPDLYDPFNVIWDEGAFFAFIFMVFILIVTITIMNMLVGILVGVISTVATVEKEQLMVCFVKDNLMALLRCMHEEDTDLDNRISKDEFRRLIQNPDAIRSFTAMGVDVVGLVDLVDFIFQDDAYLPFASFMDLVLQLRGSNSATVKDIVDLRRFITMEFNAFLHALELIPQEIELYQEVSKTVTATTFTNSKPVSLEQLSKVGPDKSAGMGSFGAKSSQHEVGILQPLVEETEKERNALTEVAGENCKKKKLKRKTSLLQNSSSTAGSIPVIHESY